MSVKMCIEESSFKTVKICKGVGGGGGGGGVKNSNWPLPVLYIGTLFCRDVVSLIYFPLFSTHINYI